MEQWCNKSSLNFYSLVATQSYKLFLREKVGDLPDHYGVNYETNLF